MRKSKSMAVGFLLGTLLCGGALGFSLDRVLTRPACDANTDRQAVRAYMASKLQLTPLQRAQVDSLLDIRHRELSRIVAPVRPQLDSVREATRVQIKRLLDPAQQQRFQDWVDESKKEESKQKCGVLSFGSGEEKPARSECSGPACIWSGCD
jgi:Spy/CpxP family protein refolding chaperone